MVWPAMSSMLGPRCNDSNAGQFRLIVIIIFELAIYSSFSMLTVTCTKFLLKRVCCRTFRPSRDREVFLSMFCTFLMGHMHNISPEMLRSK